MGQKVNPNGLRLGINRGWNSIWYASKKDFAKYLKQDIDIRRYLEETLDHTSKKKNALASKVEVKADDKKVEKKGNADARISSIEIKRIIDKNSIEINLKCQYVGVVKGTDGANIKKIKKELAKILKLNDDQVIINVIEVNNPDLDATLVAKDIARQIEQRASFRIVQKKAIQRVLKAGAKGCKTMTKGRVGGAEIARFEEYREGVLSLHTLRQPIDYAHIDAHTTYGVIGCKVWIALPDNYEELRAKKPEDNRNRSNRTFSKDSKGKNFVKKDVKAPLPNPNKDSEGTKKGE